MVETHIDVADVAKEANQHGSGTEHRDRKMEAGLVEHTQYFSEEDVDFGVTFVDEDVDSEEPGECEQNGHTNECGEENEKSCRKENHERTSPMIRLARGMRSSSILRR